MNEKIDTIDAINKVADILLLSLILMQQLTGKSREEVLAAIADESAKTDGLISKLR